jgi:UDP-2-acetamido-3-amino-2,3-dideoxy-glucuronate N-acetyltransferase
MTPFIHPSAEVEPGAVVGNGTKVWRHAHIMNGAVVGKRCVIGQGCFIAAHARVADGCKLQNNVSVYQGVVLERDVFVGPSAVFTNVRRPRAAFARSAQQYESTLVGAGATIGANATVVCGHQIGEGAMVAAGAVITRDVPPYALVMGVPARVVGWVCACGETLSRSTRRVVRTQRCSSCGWRYRSAKSGGLEKAADTSGSA